MTKNTELQTEAEVHRLSLKSCTACNKRKKKCDRHLPNCTSCAKRGVECSYDSKRRRCSACSQAKLRCSRDSPSCQRCISKGLECNYPPLYRDRKGNPAPNDSSSKKANQCQGKPMIKLMIKQNEPLCSKMEEKQHSIQHNFGAQENKSSTEQVLTVKRKQEHPVSNDFQCFSGHLSPLNQVRTGILIETQQQEMDISSSCKDIEVCKRARLFLQQNAGLGFPDAQLQKNPYGECMENVLPFIFKKEFGTHPLYKMPPKPDFQTDDCKQKQSTIKQYNVTHCCPVESGKTRRASNYSILGESASYCPADTDGDGMVIVHPKHPSPNQTRFPREGNIFSTNFALFTATFIRRYAVTHDFLVDMDMIQKALNRAFADPRGIKSLYEVPSKRSLSLHEMKERARHAGLLAVIGLGSIQHWFLDLAEHARCYNLIWHLLECCGEHVTEEVIVAHGVSAQYCKLTNNTTGLLRHFQFFTKTLESCKDNLEGRVRSIHSFFSIWECLCSSGMILECDKYTWKLMKKEANKFCCFEKDFPLMHSFLLSQAPSKLSTKHQQILSNYIKYVPSQNIGLLSLPTVSWVRKILIDAQTSDNFKAQALQEVLKLIGSASKIYQCKGARFSPTVKVFLLSTQTFLLLLAGKCSKAKETVEKQVELYSNDPFLCSALLTPTMVHQAHFLCMVLSTLELYDCYNTFQQKVNAMADISGMPHLPRQPPISNHGLCDEPECMLLWNRLSVPDLPNFSEAIFNTELWEVDI